MKKLVHVTFDWTESMMMASGQSYELTTRIGSLTLDRKVHLFSDRRGYYDGNQQPIVFTPDLAKAKKLVERSLLTALR